MVTHLSVQFYIWVHDLTWSFRDFTEVVEISPKPVTPLCTMDGNIVILTVRHYDRIDMFRYRIKAMSKIRSDLPQS